MAKTNFYSIAKRSLLAGLLIGTLSGCNETRRELSDIVYEEAKVTQKEHSDGYTTFRIIPCGNSTMIIPSTSSDGNRVTFSGDIDFTIDNEDLYNRFNEGDLVRLGYRESYKHTFEDLNKDGVKEKTQTLFEGYVFESAEKIEIK
ncbi:MAG: hypothetical protein WCI72_00975 [archaeon]